MTRTLNAQAIPRAHADGRQSNSGGRIVSETPGEQDQATHRAIEAVWRLESAKVIAVVTRLVR
ncbi:hypothetical protein ACRXB1_33565, partial [Caballeronia sp. M23-90]